MIYPPSQLNIWEEPFNRAFILSIIYSLAVFFLGLSTLNMLYQPSFIAI
jgi:hypothetical protein